MELASKHVDIIEAFAAGWGALERRLDAALSHIKGVSFAEYRLLRTLAQAYDGRASRVDLAAAVGLSPSGVTRALKPLEKLGFVETIKSDRDARLAIASLTDAGLELVADGARVVDETMDDVFDRAPGVATNATFLTKLLRELA